jgi:hypothetical protein
VQAVGLQARNHRAGEFVVEKLDAEFEGVGQGDLGGAMAAFLDCDSGKSFFSDDARQAHRDDGVLVVNRSDGQF